MLTLKRKMLLEHWNFGKRRHDTDSVGGGTVAEVLVRSRVISDIGVGVGIRIRTRTSGDCGKKLCLSSKFFG